MVESVLGCGGLLGEGKLVRPVEVRVAGRSLAESSQALRALRGLERGVFGVKTVVAL